MGGPDEKDTCSDFVLPKLLAAGWAREQILDEYPITAGRIVPVGPGGKKHRRERPLRADYVLEYRPGLPVGLVEAKRQYSIPAKGLQQAKHYGELLDLPFVYSTNGKGIVEDDRDTGLESTVTEFPSPDELWARYQAWKGITDPVAAEALVLPFNRSLRTSDGGVKEPRYYQQVAINRTVEAVIRGYKRLLLTMATGTGKTFTSMQIVWKLRTSRWRTDRLPRILYLADRNVLVDQPIEREYKPVFGDAIWKFQGEAKHGREIYFGLYQSLADSGGGQNGVFRDLDPDFFDLIVVDECHRGSGREDSSWRAILEHFKSATQIGMTATPKHDENVDTYSYFGEPIFEYSLAQGIDDGFLAPYRVRRVVLSPDALGWSPSLEQLDLFGKEIPDKLYETPDFERVVSLLARTELAAKHLSDYLAKTDRMAKTIIFCRDQEHADQMRRAMHNANPDLAKRHADYAVRIVSEEGATGKRYLSTFADTERDTPVIATTSQLLSTGVDLPTVRNIVIFRPIGSIELFKQIIGRGTRLFPDDDKLSFDIIDYSGATALFADPAFDGPAERVIEEEIDDEGNVVEEEVVSESEPPFGDEAGASDDDPATGSATIDETDLDDEPFEKFYVDSGDFYVTAEAHYQLDPTTGKLRLVQYRDYVVETVRSLCKSAKKLRKRWSDEDQRAALVTSLEGRGIDPSELGERMGMADADPLDLLVHLAWNKPLRSRAERARRVRKEHADFFAEHQAAAREVLEELLDKYTEHGPAELEDLAVLRLLPLAHRGSPAEIAGLFGGNDGLHHAVGTLRSYLYAA